jgi:DNA polymerase-4
LLDAHLWRLAEKVSDRMKAQRLAGRVVTLKLRRADFSLLTRRTSLHDPAQLADTLYHAAAGLFAAVREPGPFRLIGVGFSDLSAAPEVDPIGDLLDPAAAARAKAERASDAIRARFGAKAIIKGRALL